MQQRVEAIDTNPTRINIHDKDDANCNVLNPKEIQLHILPYEDHTMTIFNENI